MCNTGISKHGHHQSYLVWCHHQSYLVWWCCFLGQQFYTQAYSQLHFVYGQRLVLLSSDQVFSSDEVVFVITTDFLELLSFFFFQVAAMRDVSATETAIIYGLEPVWGAAFAWAMLGERWGMTGFVGAIFIIGKKHQYSLGGTKMRSSPQVLDHIFFFCTSTLMGLEL